MSWTKGYLSIVSLLLFFTMAGFNLQTFFDNLQAAGVWRHLKPYLRRATDSNETRVRNRSSSSPRVQDESSASSKSSADSTDSADWTDSTLPSKLVIGGAVCSTFLSRLKQPGDHYCKGPFPRPNASQKQIAPKVALLIRGECFRRNIAMYDRDISVTSHSKKCQTKASQSHVKHLIKPLEECGVKVDVLLASWAPSGRDAPLAQILMRGIYEPRVVSAVWHNHSYTMGPGVNGQSDNYIAALKTVRQYCKEAGTAYHGVLMLRADLVFKRPLITAPDANWSRILFAFHEWEMGGGFPSDKLVQRVPDTIFWYPWEYLNCVYEWGWHEHNSAAIHERIGTDKIGLIMPDQYHDANSMADWNPVYTQACRIPQIYDVHGGISFAFFNTREVTSEVEVQRAGETFRHSLFMQGNPLSVPPTTMVLHSWSTQKPIMGWLHTIFGNIPQGEKHEKYIGEVDDTGWLRALRSMKRTFSLFKVNMELMYRRAYYPGYEYDRVIWVRLEHSFPRIQLSCYGMNTSKTIFLDFGSKEYSTIPTLMVMSHAAAFKLGLHLEGHADRWKLGKAPPLLMGLEPWLQNVTGLATQLISWPPR